MQEVFYFSDYLVFSVSVLVAPISAGDWIHWRGPDQNGVSPDVGLPDKWSLDVNDPNSNLIWKAPYGCRSTPLVMGGRVFIIGNDGSGVHDGERVVAFDANTGKMLWEYKFNVWHTDIVASRVGWANLAGDPETNRVYAHGVQGLMLCLDGKTGQLIWQHSLTEEYGRVSGYGGRIVSPLVDENLVIVGMINASWGDYARGGCRYIAFDKHDGTVVWWSDPCGQMKGTYYSNPIVKVINGQRLLITGAADGELIALQVRTGVKAWSYPVAETVLNASPVSDGNLVFMTQGEESPAEAVQGRVVCVDAGTIENGRPKLVWEDVGVKAGLASPLLFDGKLVAVDDRGYMQCYDAKTGNETLEAKIRNARAVRRSGPTARYSSPRCSRDFHAFKPEERRCRELLNLYFPSQTGQGQVETNGTPAIANGRIYFPTSQELYCVGKKTGKTLQDRDASMPAVPLVPPGALTNDQPPAHVQVVPADVMLSAGGSAEFHVRLFDANGNFIKESAAEWSLPTPPKTPAGLQPPPLKAEVKDGKLTVAKELPGQQGYLQAKVGNLTGRARIRVAPTVGYAQDFEKVPVGALPGGWVNAQGKYQVIEMAGGKVLRKNGDKPRTAAGSSQCLHHVAVRPRLHDPSRCGRAAARRQSSRFRHRQLSVHAASERQQAGTAHPLVGSAAAHRSDHRVQVEADDVVSPQAHGRAKGRERRDSWQGLAARRCRTVHMESGSDRPQTESRGCPSYLRLCDWHRRPVGGSLLRQPQAHAE